MRRLSREEPSDGPVFAFEHFFPLLRRLAEQAV